MSVIPASGKTQDQVAPIITKQQARIIIQYITNLAAQAAYSKFTDLACELTELHKNDSSRVDGKTFLLTKIRSKKCVI